MGGCRKLFVIGCGVYLSAADTWSSTEGPILLEKILKKIKNWARACASQANIHVARNLKASSEKLRDVERCRRTIEDY
jgi:hypothetical protein